MNTILKIFKSSQVLFILVGILATSCGTAINNSLHSTEVSSQNTAPLPKPRSLVTELDQGIFATEMADVTTKISAPPSRQTNGTAKPIAVLSWPTDSCFLRDMDFPEKYLQPTESGRFESGGFGFVRENNTKYHEGIDIRSFKRDLANNPIDNVLCIKDGVVAYINNQTSNSSYGKYVIVEHSCLDIKICSLYAHLSKIQDNIKQGSPIKCGQSIGTIGTTSNVFKIDKNLAHLHFEIDLQLGNRDSFQNWYDKTYGPDDKNFHGEWNGLNLIGTDPIPMLRALNNGNSIASVLEKEPTAFVTRTFSDKIPYFVEKYNKLLDKKLDPTNSLIAWDIEWTWYGLPKKFTPKYSQDIKKKIKAGETIIIEYRKSTKDLAEKRDLFSIRNWQPVIGNRIKDTLEKLGL
ncbi:MAG: M23 family metallopeptidase [Puniceicoccales bacterium]|jgi:murein DD-endopeptidase MepM/ murein hydrolase activator NlpD|nr:M23 family metallopeptidase [Puniceicoccales bacterium]